MRAVPAAAAVRAATADLNHSGGGSLGGGLLLALLVRLPEQANNLVMGGGVGVGEAACGRGEGPGWVSTRQLERAQLAFNATSAG